MKRASIFMWITALMACSAAFSQEPADTPVTPDTMEITQDLSPDATGDAPAGVGAPAPSASVSGAESVDSTPESRTLAQAVEQEEQVRRQTKEIAAQSTFDDAEELFAQAQFKSALEKYEEVLKTAPERPASDDLRQAAKKQAGEARMKLAEEAYRSDNLTEARKLAEDAKASDPSLADRSEKLIVRTTRRETLIKKRDAVPVPPAEKSATLDKSRDISQLFNEGRQWFAVEDYDKAEGQFEAILLKDPYNRDAMRFLKKIEEKRLQAWNTHREATIVGMTEEVRRRWTPPIRASVAKEAQRVDSGPIANESRQQKLVAKMSSLVIPALDFRQANIVDVINFLREASQASDVDGVGVNILLKLPDGASTASATPDTGADPWATPSAGEAGAETTGTAPSSSIPAITLSLRKVTLMAAIKYVTEVAGLKYRIEDAAVIIYPAGFVVEAIITRLYPVMPTILDVVGEASDKAGGTSEFGEFTEESAGPKDNLKAFFEQNGVPFPVGSSITYNSTISKLIVANTAENLDRFETILQRINVIPSQVEIEARFVEINQNDLNELGLQWLLTDDWQVASKNGGGMGEPSIQVDENVSGSGNVGFTKGLRYMGSTPDNIPVPQFSSAAAAGTMLGSLLSVSGILTNPELTVVLHALDMQGGSDLLSAPRITTRSGNNAQIQVVTEIIYPSEYEQQDIGDIAFTQVGGITDSVLRRPPLPAQFETRDTGIILNVTPTVGPDAYTIDLTLVPEVAELIDWIDYGPPGEYPILQPVFDTRNAQTSVVIWDGATLTLGGLIREAVTRMDDKIPLLGDIPVLGWLFRSKGEYSAKKNLIIFVTARIIDPAGNPIRSPEASGASAETAAK
jgi:general secretion pathway protein D